MPIMLIKASDILLGNMQFPLNKLKVDDAMTHCFVPSPRDSLRVLGPELSENVHSITATVHRQSLGDALQSFGERIDNDLLPAWHGAGIGTEVAG